MVDFLDVKKFSPRLSAVTAKSNMEAHATDAPTIRHGVPYSRGNVEARHDTALQAAQNLRTVQTIDASISFNVSINVCVVWSAVTLPTVTDTKCSVLHLRRLKTRIPQQSRPLSKPKALNNAWRLDDASS